MLMPADNVGDASSHRVLLRQLMPVLRTSIGAANLLRRA